MSVLDSNLPIFRLLPSRTSPTTETTISQSQHDSTPSPKYLKRRDPSLTDTYSITLLDAHYPDIIYASLSAFAIYPPISTPSKPRKNSSSQPGAPPPPPDPPKVPAQLTIGLYNPDSRVILTQKPSSWGSGPYWEFSLPKTSFLQPTGSRLDHELGAAGKLLATVPMATFRWRKEGGVLTRGSLRCSLIHENNVLHENGGGGPAAPTDSNSNEKRKTSGPSEPDITVAIFTNGLMGGKSAGKGEVTIFEPNLRRIEVEDLKGLEVTLVMTAMAIADMYFGDMRTGFNLGPRAPAGFSGPGRTATIGKGQPVDMGTVNPGFVIPGGAAPVPADARRGSAVNGAGSGSSSAAPPPPYAGGPPPGFTGDTKVRPTQEQLLNPAYQQQLRDEERRKKEAAERAEREAHEAAARRRREMIEQARLAEQEAEARRLQRQFEVEAARETARIEAETRRLREEWERERAEMERQGRRAGGVSGNSRPQSQPGAAGRQYQPHFFHSHHQQQQPVYRPPLVAVNGVPPRGGSQAQNTTMSGANYGPVYPPRPQNGQHLAPQMKSKKSGWFGGGSGSGGKTLDQVKDRRRSFMGLRIFGESHSGSGSTSPPKQKEKEKEKEKGKGKLAKKKSGMW